jgi:protein TonB
VISASEIRCPTPAQAAFPEASQLRGETGVTQVRVLIDASGRPQDVLLHRSSGFARLDKAALAGVRTLRCHPYTEAGVAQAVWVVAPIAFELN